MCKRSGLGPAALKTRIELSPLNANREPESVKPTIVDEPIDKFGVMPR